jgi:hypothetical protein
MTDEEFRTIVDSIDKQQFQLIQRVNRARHVADVLTRDAARLAASTSIERILTRTAHGVPWHSRDARRSGARVN